MNSEATRPSAKYSATAQAPVSAPCAIPLRGTGRAAQYPAATNSTNEAGGITALIVDWASAIVA